MSLVWHVIVSCGVCTAWINVLRARSALRSTTLISAWNWSLLGASVWGLTWFLDSYGKRLSPAAADHAWYASAVLALCPPMAVLGSRRPGTRVWSWFILLPMLLALWWPIIALRLQGSEFRGLQLETPQLIAFGLVLVMGVGNYCGTRFTLAALIYGTATLATVMSCSSMFSGWFADRSVTRFWSTVAMVCATSGLLTSSRAVAVTRFDRLWFDFFDMFGIVWGRRIQDRVNYLAIKERWPIRLELDGFVTLDNSSRTGSVTEKLGEGIDKGGPHIEDPRLANLESSTRIEHTLRWLLRRFVDPVWIDDRLESAGTTEATDITVDS